MFTLPVGANAKGGRVPLLLYDRLLIEQAKYIEDEFEGLLAHPTPWPSPERCVEVRYSLIRNGQDILDDTSREAKEISPGDHQRILSVMDRLRAKRSKWRRKLPTEPDHITMIGALEHFYMPDARSQPECYRICTDPTTNENVLTILWGVSPSQEKIEVITGVGIEATPEDIAAVIPGKASADGDSNPSIPVTSDASRCPWMPLLLSALGVVVLCVLLWLLMRSCHSEASRADEDTWGPIVVVREGPVGDDSSEGNSNQVGVAPGFDTEAGPAPTPPGAGMPEWREVEDAIQEPAEPVVGINTQPPSIPITTQSPSIPHTIGGSLVPEAGQMMPISSPGVIEPSGLRFAWKLQGGTAPVDPVWFEPYFPPLRGIITARCTNHYLLLIADSQGNKLLEQHILWIYEPNK